MGADPLPLNPSKSNLNGEDKDVLLALIDEYQNLLDYQTNERKELLSKIDDRTMQQSNDMINIDSRLQQFSAILIDIRHQISALSKNKSTTIPRPTNSSKQIVMATPEDIVKLADEVETKKTDIDSEVKNLINLLDSKKVELNGKDMQIEELNDKLDLLSDEKIRLAEELENLNGIIESWKTQLDVLQKLAASDPRYKLIAALKKHGSLSDIQLAFTMGSSIKQLRIYIEDLISLNIIKKASNGKYKWIGKEFDGEIEF